jgi:hypothetical protein
MKIGLLYLFKRAGMPAHNWHEGKTLRASSRIASRGREISRTITARHLRYRLKSQRHETSAHPHHRLAHLGNSCPRTGQTAQD